MCRRGQGEAGFTLIEMLIVVMLLGVGFVAIIGGMATSMVASTLHRDQAQAETEVRRYAEVIKQEPASTSCPATYASVSFTPTAEDSSGAPYVASPPVVDRYVDEDGAPANCSDSPAPMQVVQVSVTSADGKATETVEVLKRPST